MEGIAAGGGSNEGAIGAVEIYNPDLDTWQLIEDMNMFRHHHTATLLANGEVLMVSGYAWSPATALVILVAQPPALPARWATTSSMVHPSLVLSLAHV